MRNPTELMQQILQNEISQRIIDYVSPIYGDSYVGLWIYESIGGVLKEVVDIAEALKSEGNPATSVLLLDYWEEYYQLPTDPTLNTEQRQQRIIAKIRQRGPLNPTALSQMVSAAIGGIPVDITENVAKNTFQVNLRDFPESISPAIAVLDKRKPAHLIYWLYIYLQTEASAQIKTAVASTSGEKEEFFVEVQQYKDEILTSPEIKTAVAITTTDIYRVEVEQ